MPAERSKIVEILPSGFISVSPEGGIKEINSYLLDLLEYPNKDLLIGKDFFKLLSAGSKLFYEFHVNPVLHLSGIIKEIKLDLKKKTGSLVNVLVNLRVVHDENKQLEEIQISVFDFTKRENFEIEIIKTNKRYAELAEKLQEQNQQIKELNSRIEKLLHDAPIGVFEFSLNADGKMEITYANDEFYEIFAPFLNNQKTLVPEILLSFMEVNERENYIKNIYQSYENMTVFKEEFDLYYNEEEKISVRIISHPLSKEKGKVIWNGSVENITEKKALAEKLQYFKQGFSNKKSRFELLTNFNKIGYWELNLQIGEGIINHVFYSLLGRNLPGNIFENNANFFHECVLFLHPDDSDLFIAKQKLVLNSKAEFFEFEGRMLHANGSWVWIWTKASIVKDADCEVLVGTCIDISKQKELEENEYKNNEILKESNRKYEDILNNSSDLIITLNSELKIDFVNKTWLNKTMFDDDELIGKSIMELIPEYDFDSFFKCMNQLSQAELELEVEINLNCKNGKILSCLAKLNSTFQSNKLVNIRGFFKDITDQKEVSIRFDHTLNHIKDGYVFIDFNFYILEWNKYAEKIIGLSREDVIYRSLNEIFVDMVDTDLFKKVKVLMVNRSFEDFEYFSINKNIWLHLIFTPTLNGMSILFSDVTERKRQEGLLRLETNVYSYFINNKNDEIDILLESICKQIKEIHPKMFFSTLKILNSRIYNWVSLGLPSEYLEAIEGLEIGPKSGSCGTAAFIKKNVIVEDIHTSPLWEDYIQIANKFKLGSCWSFPIFSEENEVIATFAIYHEYKKIMTDSEFNTIDKVRFLIQSLLQINRSTIRNKKLDLFNKSIINSSLNAIFISRSNGECMLWNPQAEKVFGWKQQEILGQNLAKKLVPNRFLPRVIEQISFFL
jgi:PAS domain S-box-containing protein